MSFFLLICFYIVGLDGQCRRPRTQTSRPTRSDDGEDEGDDDYVDVVVYVDVDEDNDGFASFDLETRTLEIIGGELDTQVTYHETLEDANMGDNPLASPYTNIVANEQIIYIRLTNTVTGCYNTSETLTLRVLESPEVPVAIDDYVICDTNSDGIAQFDLTSKDINKTFFIRF